MVHLTLFVFFAEFTWIDEICGEAASGMQNLLL